MGRYSLTKKRKDVEKEFAARLRRFSLTGGA